MWVFLWWETQTDGTKKRRKQTVGEMTEFPTKASAEKALGGLRVNINQELSHTNFAAMTIEVLVNHYRKNELLKDSDAGKAHSTKEAYECYLTNWILPRWRSHKLTEVKTVAVEGWLSEIKRARATKAKIRNIMSALFNHAMRYEWLDKNPITLVRQSAKRERVPEYLEIHELRALLAELKEREKTLVLLDAATGIRRGELLALKWEDVDFERLELKVMRSIVHQVVGRCKTETSQKPVPLDALLVEVLRQWQASTPYNAPQNWIFASPAKKGEQPYWPDQLMKRHIRPAARRAGITKRIGWHTFRHTFSTLLKANGEDVKVVQELLRHANCRITLDIYTQAVTPAKRAAQTKVVEMMIAKPEIANGALSEPQISAVSVSH
jgi:integrase